MSNFETLTLCISLLAVVIAAVSLWRTSRTNAEQLAKKQLDQIRKESASQHSAMITFRMERVSQKSLKFVVANLGPASAEKISFKLVPQGNGDLPDMAKDYEERFPVPVLAPGGVATASAYFQLGCATSFAVMLSWRNATGEMKQQETYVSL